MFCCACITKSPSLEGRPDGVVPSSLDKTPAESGLGSEADDRCEQGVQAGGGGTLEERGIQTDDGCGLERKPSRPVSAPPVVAEVLAHSVDEESGEVDEERLTACVAAGRRDSGVQKETSVDILEKEIADRIVGRDELELRRKKFFEEMTTPPDESPRVRFLDTPEVLGAAGSSPDTHPPPHLDKDMSKHLENLVNRLENVATRLEAIAVKKNVSSGQQDEELSRSVLQFDELLNGPFNQYLLASQQIGGDVGQHAQMVQAAFSEERNFIAVASKSQEPDQSTLIHLLKPTSEKIQQIQEFREQNRRSNYFNHLSAISESVPALGWVTVSPAPSPFVKEMNDAGQFYTNRVLKEWRDKDKIHVDWVRSWCQTLVELQSYVKEHHTTGLVWNPSGVPPTSVVTAPSGAPPPPPPPPGPPPPPPPMDFDISSNNTQTQAAALFAEINAGGENIAKGLKRVTPDMQTHKNPALRSGPAPFKAPVAGPTPYNKTSPMKPAPEDKPPRFLLEGKKWIVEYQKDNPSLVIDSSAMNQVVYMYRCVNSTLQVKGKINSVVMDSCKKSSVVFDSLVATMEMINCQSVQMQVLGKVPTITVDKTDGCQMYLSPESSDVEIISAKSSEMNVLVPQGDGDYVEYPVPEMFKTKLGGKKGLTTNVAESC